MFRRIPLLIALAALPLAAAAAVATAFASSATPALLSCSGAHLVRPAGTVVLSCADGNSLIRDTRWQSWNAAGATGTTDFGLNLCTPTCVASRIRFFPGSAIRLVGATRTSKGLLFSRAVIRYTLNGEQRTFTAYPET